MKLNNKGVSMLVLGITIIVIVILASIAISTGFTNVDKAQQAVFLSELEMANDALNVYNERAILYGKRDYNKNRLYWDGMSEFLSNSAKTDYLTNDSNGQKINPKYLNSDEWTQLENAPEDKAIFLFNGEIPNSLKEKIYIYDGILGVYSIYQEEYALATEKYEFMKNGQFNSYEEFNSYVNAH